MKNYRLLFSIIFFAYSIFLTACKDQQGEEILSSDETQNNIITEVFNQEILDNAVLVVQNSDLGITGNPFGTRFAAAEINSIRDISTNKRTNERIRAGHVFVIKSFQNQNGQKGQLINIHIMVKRENGFNPTGGDFEYINIDFDPTTDYAQHPNGELPALTDTANRGLDITRFACVNCHRHSSTNGDFLFTDK
jgi:hypothetical protein